MSYFLPSGPLVRFFIWKIFFIRYMAFQRGAGWVHYHFCFLFLGCAAYMCLIGGILIEIIKLVPFGPSVKSSCFSSGRYFSYGTWLFKGAEAGRRRVMLGELVGCITIFAFLFLGCAAYGATSGL